MTQDRKRPRPDAATPEEEDVVRLEDLAPRDEHVKGGARKIRFGEPQPPRTSLRKRAP